MSPEPKIARDKALNLRQLLGRLLGTQELLGVNTKIFTARYGQIEGPSKASSRMQSLHLP